MFDDCGDSVRPAVLDWTVIHPANCEYWIRQWMLGLAL